MRHHVIKASGISESFDPQKTKASYLRAGATPELADKTLHTIQREIKAGTTTQDIYTHGLDYLHKHAPAIAGRYSLKRAIMSLGPTGYVFEKYIARLLEAEGYMTSVSQLVKGRCVTQEIDVIARQGSQKMMVECKFHNRPGLKSDLKVALYTQARFQDVQERGEFTEAWLVTNTHSTTEAGKYARCMGMKLIAWRYPYKAGLEARIETNRLYPITILPALQPNTLQAFVNAGILLLQDLAPLTDRDLVRLFGLKPGTAKRLVHDASLLHQELI